MLDMYIEITVSKSYVLQSEFYNAPSYVSNGATKYACS